VKSFVGYYSAVTLLAFVGVFSPTHLWSTLGLVLWIAASFCALLTLFESIREGESLVSVIARLCLAPTLAWVLMLMLISTPIGFPSQL
jgi:hypothetical protein